MANLHKSFYRYLPVSPTDQDWGLYLTAAGCTHIPPGKAYPPAPHPSGYHFSWERGRTLEEFQIIYITGGEGVFETQEQGRRRIEPGSVLLLFPGVWHRYRPSPKTGWNEFWFGLRGEQIERLAERGFISPQRPVLNLGLDDTLLGQFLQLLGNVEAEPIGYQQIVAAQALEILATLLARQRASQVGHRHIEALVGRVKCLLAERLDQEVDMRAIAHELHVSYAYLRRTFKQCTGLAPNQYHLHLRVTRARELLSETGLTVKQVAATLGFENQYYFSKIFKKKTGQSPAQWRGGRAVGGAGNVIEIGAAD